MVVTNESAIRPSNPEHMKESADSLRGSRRASDSRRIGARPMSLLSERFFRQEVVKVGGELLELNENAIPNLPMLKEKISEEMSFFVDWSGKGRGTALLGMPKHGRALYFNIRFSDIHGNVYNYISVKGPGMPEDSLIAKFEYDKPFSSAGENSGMWGLQEYWGAKTDFDNGNEFLKRGIQTSLPIAIIKLDKLVLRNGTRWGIETLKKRKIVPGAIKYDDGVTNYTPVIYLVGFSEAMRVIDARTDDLKKLANERGVKDKEYVEWWLGKAAKNIALLHDMGKVHTFLTEHNLTLDGCFVDNDHARTVDDSERETGRAYCNDLSTAMRTAFALNRRMSKPVADDKLREVFRHEYWNNRHNINVEELGAVDATIMGE
jgi:hypothetical protein